MRLRNLEIALAVMDGRESYRAIGRKYGVSYEAVRQTANRVCKAAVEEYYHKVQHVEVHAVRDFTRGDMVGLKVWFVSLFRTCWPGLVEECGRAGVDMERRDG